ncbi:hypothetical protein XENOCAPTIV_013729 [Xenoophorus captivus]|uniref:Uncharacterized protein n=1 Tax=Xenoophorus captivus TaxID=1517983 RepID=A0ABV0QDA4_9TELE
MNYIPVCSALSTSKEESRFYLLNNKIMISAGHNSGSCVHAKVPLSCFFGFFLDTIVYIFLEPNCIQVSTIRLKRSPSDKRIFQAELKFAAVQVVAEPNAFFGKVLQKRHCPQ